MPRFQRREKLVEEPKCPAPKITDGRMEINGMNGNDCGKATGKAILGYLQACPDGKLRDTAGSKSIERYKCRMPFPSKSGGIALPGPF